MLNILFVSLRCHNSLYRPSLTGLPTLLGSGVMKAGSFSSRFHFKVGKLLAYFKPQHPTQYLAFIGYLLYERYCMFEICAADRGFVATLST